MNGTSIARLTRTDAETFLYREAGLLDDWKLEDWSDLFTVDGEYLVPPLDDPNGEPGKCLFFIYDDRHRLKERAIRLLKKNAHAEFPRSKVRHMVSNVRVDELDSELTRVTCNFVVYRSRNGQTEVFPGHAIYDLVVSSPTDISIRRKRAVLDSDTLRDQARISIIL